MSQACNAVSVNRDLHITNGMRKDFEDVVPQDFPQILLDVFVHLHLHETVERWNFLLVHHKAPRRANPLTQIMWVYLILSSVAPEMLEKFAEIKPL